MLVLVWLVISDLYLFHLIVLLSPDLIALKNNYHFQLIKQQLEHTVVCVILNFAFVGAFIAGIAGLFSCAATAACVVISVKNTIFRPR